MFPGFTLGPVRRRGNGIRHPAKTTAAAPVIMYAQHGLSVLGIRLEVQGDIKRHFILEELRTFELADGRIYAIVAHNREMRLIHDFWVGDFDDQAAFRAVLAFILERIQSGPYSLWLADIRHMSRSFMASNQWIVNELVPKLLEAGLEREAVVLPPSSDIPEGFDVFGAATAALHDIADGRIRGFTDIESAKRWLIEGVLRRP